MLLEYLNTSNVTVNPYLTDLICYQASFKYI